MEKLFRSAAALLVALLALSTTCSWMLLAEARVCQFSAINETTNNPPIGVERVWFPLNEVLNSSLVNGEIVYRRSLKPDPPSNNTDPPNYGGIPLDYGVIPIPRPPNAHPRM